MALIFSMLAIMALLVGLSTLTMYLLCVIFNINVSRVQLFLFTVFKFRIGDTDFRIGVLPVSGYIEPKGLVDKGEKEIDTDDFRYKGKYVRLLVLSSTFLTFLTVTVLYSQFIDSLIGIMSYKEILVRTMNFSIGSFVGNQGQFLMLMFSFALIQTCSAFVMLVFNLWERALAGDHRKEALVEHAGNVANVIIFCFLVYFVYKVIV